jgi:hypothetical protein
VPNEAPSEGSLRRRAGTTRRTSTPRTGKGMVAKPRSSASDTARHGTSRAMSSAMTGAIISAWWRGFE